MSLHVRYHRSLFLLSWVLFFAAVAAAQVQTGPILEPRALQKPAPTVAKGAAAITEQQEKCSTRLVIDANALFEPHRWTLNPDAAQTLDVLGPMIVKAGHHPARILAKTDSAELDSENRDVSQRRALTVRTWLVNHRFIAEGTPIEALGSKRASTAPNEAHSAEPVREPSKNGTVDVLVDTCN